MVHTTLGGWCTVRMDNAPLQVGWTVTPRPEESPSGDIAISKYGGIWNEMDWHSMYNANYVPNIPHVGRPLPIAEAWDLVSTTSSRASLGKRASCDDAKDLFHHETADLVVSRHGETRPRGGILRDYVAAWKAAGAPKDIVDTVEKGHLSKMVGRMMPCVFKNGPNTAAFTEFITREIDNLLDIGSIGLWDVASMGYPTIINPIDVAEGAKLRLIADERYPNTGVVVGDMSLPRVEDLFTVINRSAMLRKSDLKSGYHHVALHHSMYYMMVFRWDGVLYFWKVVPFGLADAPRTFQRLTTFSLRLVLNKFPHLAGIVYLDDFGLVCQPGGEVDPHPVWMELGWVFSKSKCLPWAPTTELLGFVLDAPAQRISLTDKRCDAVTSSVKSIIDGPKMVPARELGRMMGKLASAAPAVTLAIFWSRPLIEAMQATLGDLFRTIDPRLWGRKIPWDSPNIHVSDSAVSSLEILLLHWDYFHGRDINTSPGPNTLVCESDASKDGAGGVSFFLGAAKDNVVLWREPLPHDLRDRSSFIRETWAYVIHTELAVRTVCPQSIFVLTDNLSLLYAHSSGGHCPFCHDLLRWLFKIQAVRGIPIIGMRHIPTLLNAGSDALSRVKPCAAAIRVCTSWFNIWMSTLRSEEVPTVDAMATRDDACLPNFISWTLEEGAMGRDFFRTEIPPFAWVFPPPYLVGEVFVHLRAQQGLFYLVVPDQTGSPWCCLLRGQKRLAAVPVLGPEGFYMPRTWTFSLYLICTTTLCRTLSL